MRIDVEALRKQRLSCLVIDEALNIKNNRAATTKALKSIKVGCLGSPYLHP
jgi:SNF2 family DNA or RNA helicase